MKKLGFGLMRLPLVNDDFSQPDKAQLCDMVDFSLQKDFSILIRHGSIITGNRKLP